MLVETFQKLTRNPGMGAKAELTLQNWGNNLAVRVPAAVACEARLVRGQLVIVEAMDDRIVARPQGRLARMTIEQRVKAFDPKIHGGEAMRDAPRGVEFRSC